MTAPVPDDDHAGGGGRGPAVLGEDECRVLLARHSLGRLGFVSDEGWPVIPPVNDVFEEPSIVVRTGAGTKLSDIPLTMVAFDADS